MLIKRFEYPLHLYWLRKPSDIFKCHVFKIYFNPIVECLDKKDPAKLEVRLSIKILFNDDNMSEVVFFFHSMKWQKIGANEKEVSPTDLTSLKKMSLKARDKNF